MPKTLKQCLSYIGIESEDERMIHRISCDSRECDEFSIYAGDRYCEEALQKNAFVVEKKYAGELIHRFYDCVSDDYFVIGVSGTNGKTSVTHFLKEMLTKLGKKCIRLGTHYHEFEDERVESLNTTMGIMDNLEVFLKYRRKVDVIIMEVSSHAIAQGRVDFIRFDRILYTNVTPEHLDYHLTFTHYAYTKFSLYHLLKENGRVLLHYDQKNLHPFLRLFHKNVICYGLKGNFRVHILENTLMHSRFEIKNVLFEMNIGGDFSIMNMTGVLGCLVSMGYSLNQCQRGVKELTGVEGRMEILDFHDRKVVIDYAHTPASLEQLCLFLKKHGDLIVVFGCGGERDVAKRPLMAQIACQYGYRVVVTEDNNRHEAFEQIVSDMKVERFDHAIVIEKRQDALRYAFQVSEKHDIILIAGKGNEKFLIAKGVKTPYNDKAWLLSM